MPRPRVLIADTVSPVCAQTLKSAGLEVETRTGLSEADLAAAVASFDGLIVRSAVKVTAPILSAGRRLRIVGRAGVGVDNIDVPAATKAGIVVENTPLGNIVSAAEHAIALLFSLARNVPAADREMKAGAWPKKGMTGVELSGKTLGIVGLGRVGTIVARVARCLPMTVLVYDPYLTEKKAAELGVERSELDPMLERADFVTVHAPLTKETAGLLDAARLGRMKKGARLVNDARGGIVREADLLEALQAGRLAGAALDVFETEPLPADSPLRAQANLILTPHLGASTEEAQERVAEEIARQFVEFFHDGTIRNAVNISVTLEPRLAPYGRLAEALGAMAAQLSRGPVTKLTVGCFGRLAAADTRPFTLMALKGLLSRTTGDAVTLVNAPSIAEASGLQLVEHKSDQVLNYPSLLTVSAATASDEREMAGTCFDDRDPRVVGIDGLDIDLKPAGRILLMAYRDRPGVVGRIGTLLGAADVNIATMAVGRREKRGQAVVALTVDDAVSKELLESIRKEIGPEELHLIELPGV